MDGQVNGKDPVPGSGVRLPLSSEEDYTKLLGILNEQLAVLKDKAGDSARLEMNVHSVARKFILNVRLRPNDIRLLIACAGIASAALAIAEWESTHE